MPPSVGQPCGINRNDQHSTFLGVTNSPLGAPFYFTLNDVSYVVKLSDLFKLGSDHTFRASLEYRNNTATSQVLMNGSTSYDIYAASAMWNWQITPKISPSRRRSGTPQKEPTASWPPPASWLRS